MKDINVELLAPVGSMEALFAAIQNGADAIYLGGKLFNARKFASNFDYEDLEFVVNYAHLRNVKVYITVNILIDNGEIKQTLDYIRYLNKINVDGIIVQDLGLAYLIKNIFPDIELHASTQMTINNLPGAIFLENFGFERVVLARETPLDEIKYIYENSHIGLEGFIHGALCMCYSGQCFMSSIIGGRSGNRGKCAQPCRMPYSFIDYANDELVFPKWREMYLLSPKDLNTGKYIKDIINSGISSLKIEGRMKKPEYVSTVVGSYRKVLDEGYDALTSDTQEEIKQIFNRGFTKGLMLGDFGKEFMSYDRPDNRGILVGNVEDIDKNYIYIKLCHSVEIGDGLEFQTPGGDYTGSVLNFSASKGRIIKVIKTKHVSIGSKVYRTSSARLLDKARESYQCENIKYLIDMSIKIEIGKPAELNIVYKGKMFTIESDYITEKAKRVELTRDRIIEQLSKLNDTVYQINKVEVAVDNNSFMPISEINELRRRGIELIDNTRRNSNRRSNISDMEYKNKLGKYFKFNKLDILPRKNISVGVSKVNQLEQLNLQKLDRIYLGFTNGLEEAVLKVKEEGKEVYLLTDRILYKEGLGKLKERINKLKDLIDGVSVDNLGTLQFIRENFYLDIHGDIGLNIFNSFTVKSLTEAGLKSMTLSPELNMKQIKILCSDRISSYETIGYGYLPLMITKNCPMALLKNCIDELNCKTCKFKEGYGIKDRKGVNFHMERKDGFSTIYNSFPLMILDDIHQVYNSGVDMIRVDFTFENQGIQQIQDIYFDYAKMKLSYEEVIDFINKYRRKKNITKGHYFRGVT